MLMMQPAENVHAAMNRRPHLSAGVDHFAAAPIIGWQFASWAPNSGEQEHYRWKIAPARTYAESPDVSIMLPRMHIGTAT